MNEGIAAALRDIAQVFASYPRRPVLERCPHCGPPVRVEEVDLFWLSIKLGNTVGDGTDVKALLPLLFERLITTNELDPDIVLGKLAQQKWESWPLDERLAIETFLDRAWLFLLSEFPSRAGTFADCAEFLRATAAAAIPPDRFLALWDASTGAAADRHLAEFVTIALTSRRIEPEIRAWIGRKSLRDRLLRAFEQNDDDPESADAFACAYDNACVLESA
ncbi:hypothetical protein [Nocardia concava]|uniref:hypothetical protein n=1 Tax=Nocardia concava TaxID=257281 RepID=UPI0005940F42|nr:hypothetical protein [Nocardia concava]